MRPTAVVIATFGVFLCINNVLPAVNDKKWSKPILNNRTDHHRVARAIGSAPISGGWSAWAPAICSNPCGAGRNLHRRLCNNPWPVNDGKPCDGPAEKLSDTMDCLDGPCVIEYEGKHDHHLARWQELTMDSVEVSGGKAILFCGGRVLSSYRIVDPDAAISWFHNGVELDLTSDINKARMKVVDSLTTKCQRLEIKPVYHSDTGSYSCRLQLLTSKFPRFKEDSTYMMNFMTLTINPPPLVAGFPNHEIVLPCLAGDIPNNHYLYLEMIFVYIWRHMGNIVDISDEPRNRVIHSLTSDNAGHWECLVVHEPTKRIWKTNSLTLVIPCMEDAWLL